MSNPKKTGKALAIHRTGNVVQLRIRPTDIRTLEWSDKTDFARVRAQWLELLRRDAELLPSTIVVLTEIANRMSWDKDGAWPSIPRLAADLGLSESTVKRAVALALVRGWLTCERRGFSGSNCYSMTASARIVEEVYKAHEGRLACREARKASAPGAAIQVTGDLPLRSSVTSHSGHQRPLIEVTSDPLIVSENPTIEVAPTDSRKRLTGAAALAAVLHLLGEGDVPKGQEIAARLPAERVAFLVDLICRGSKTAPAKAAVAEAIEAAAADARRLAASTPSAPSPVIVLADARPAAPPRSRRAQPKADGAQSDLFTVDVSSPTVP